MTARLYFCTCGERFASHDGYYDHPCDFRADDPDQRACVGCDRYRKDGSGDSWPANLCPSCTRESLVGNGGAAPSGATATESGDGGLSRMNRRAPIACIECGAPGPHAFNLCVPCTRESLARSVEHVALESLEYARGGDA